MGFPGGVLGWNLSLAAPAMLWGLAGLSIPVVIHILNRRRATTLDWGAMQFLSLGRRAQRRFQITELLLMLGRMALLALVALALARPILAPSSAAPAPADQAVMATALARGEPADLALVIDGSESMGRVARGATVRQRALDWASALVGDLPAGSTVAVFDARDRVRPLLAAPTADLRQAREALANASVPRGGSDLAAAVAQALQSLATTRNASRQVIILTDGQRFAWRPWETARWNLIKDVYKSTYRNAAFAPRLLALELAADGEAATADGSVGPLRLSRPYVPANAQIRLMGNVANAGPGVLEREAELLIDGVAQPESRQHVGPLPAGGQFPLVFETKLASPGARVLSVRLTPGADPLEANDRADLPIEVIAGLPLLVVDGGLDQESRGEDTLFVRAALSPAGDEAPAVRTTVVGVRGLTSQTAEAARVIVLANVQRLSEAQMAVINDRLAQGCGVLVVPGRRCDRRFYEAAASGADGVWLPARLADWNEAQPGSANARPARPLASSFAGPLMASFADSAAPDLAQAKLFAYFKLEPTVGSTVSARLDDGLPWVVERSARAGRMAMLAGPLDASGGTLPVNGDFVPWMHGLIFSLAGEESAAPAVSPGTALQMRLDDARIEGAETLELHAPGSVLGVVPIARDLGRASARVTQTQDGGLYQLTLPGSETAVANFLVVSDSREREPALRTRDDAAQLAKAWPLSFESDEKRAMDRLRGTGRAAPRAMWRWLVAAALAGLCLEVAATRRLARARGLDETAA